MICQYMAAASGRAGVIVKTPQWLWPITAHHKGTRQSASVDSRPCRQSVYQAHGSEALLLTGGSSHGQHEGQEPVTSEC